MVQYGGVTIIPVTTYYWVCNKFKSNGITVRRHYFNNCNGQKGGKKKI